jgi:hypothetical protein
MTTTIHNGLTAALMNKDVALETRTSFGRRRYDARNHADPEPVGVKAAELRSALSLLA